MHSRRYNFYFALYSLTIHNELVVFVYFDLANNLFFLHMLTILYTCLLFIIWLLLHLNADSYALIIDDESPPYVILKTRSSCCPLIIFSHLNIEIMKSYWFLPVELFSENAIFYWRILSIQLSFLCLELTACEQYHEIRVFFIDRWLCLFCIHLVAYQGIIRAYR